MTREPLRDGHGRLIGDLRVSVTDRCNFRCQYCMPAEGLPWLDRAELLTFEEIERINVSLDSLSRDRFFEITRRDSLPQVIRGLETLERFPQLGPVKVNCVAMRGFTEDEVIPFAELARRKPYQVRFIEFMPLDADHAWSTDRVLTGDEIRAAIDAVYPLEPEPREPSATARVWRFRDGRGEVGFVNPVSEPFCSDCDRIRLTAEGKLRTCLFSLHETDLREPLRSEAGDDELVETIRDAVWRKELKHHVSEPGFRQPPGTMSQIGGRPSNTRT